MKMQGKREKKKTERMLRYEKKKKNEMWRKTNENMKKRQE